MNNGFFEEGDRCPECAQGELRYLPAEDCSCHISPPCSACVDNELECNKCYWIPEEPRYRTSH